MQRFRFGRVDGTTIGVIALAPDGTLIGSHRPNEHSWTVDGGFLAFRDVQGRVTTSFNRVAQDGGRTMLIGAFLPRGAEPWHTLTEITEQASIVAALRTALYGDESPLAFADHAAVDSGYPHTNLQADVVRSVLDAVKPRFWLEFGSMLGGSAIRAAEVIKQQRAPTEIVCVDPFTGDVNMWDWEQKHRRIGAWRFLRLQRGRPTIYDRFLANVAVSGHADIILPIAATSIVGAKLLLRLFAQGRISALPDVIYLDSAHEPDETFLELKTSWTLLRPGGALLGDDWSWDAVRQDVLRFAPLVPIDAAGRDRLAARHGGCTEQDGVLLLGNGQWALMK